VSTDDPERSVALHEAREALARFLEELDADRWAVFVLSEIEGLRGTEISAELGVKLSTVYARLRSAQRAFDRALSRRRARGRRWSRLGGLLAWRPAASFAAVSLRLLAAIVVAVIGIAVTAWVAVGDRGGAVESVVVHENPRLAAEPRPPSSSTRARSHGVPKPVALPLRRADEREATSSPQLTDPQRRAIEAFAALYRGFDDERYRALFDVDDEPWILREQLEWFTAVLGDCGPPEPLRIESDTAARFVFRCDTGELEVEIHLADADTHRMRGVASGVRGVEPPEAVLTAAHDALALYHDFDAAAVPAVFEERFDPIALEAALAEARANWGACTLGNVDLARHRGALFDLNCEIGPRLLKVELGEDDRITRLLLSERRPVEIREG
jgi:hypothetical protein